nr:RNA-directed DNA polymerase, eukaryota, reverse transcriptase zinc-binding domain protein [Tanacetum cinerariifolium]
MEPKSGGGGGSKSLYERWKEDNERLVRAGSEHQQIVGLNSLLESVSLSQSHDRWFCDLTGDGEFRVKEMRVSPDHYSPDMSMVGVGLTGSYVLFRLAELVFFYSSSV